MRDGVPWHGDVRTRYPGLADRVLDEIRERGPLGSKDFAGKADPSPHRVGTSSEAMWSWKPAKQMLDALFASGELVVAERVNFQRRYDLPERVLPREILDAPVPSEEEAVQGADREGRSRPRSAARVRDRRARAADLGPHSEAPRSARPYVDSLVAEGKLERIAVDDGRRAGRRRGRGRARPTATERRRPAVAVRQPALGVTTTSGAHPRVQARDRAVQAGAAAALRLLRPAVPVARPDRRPRGPEVGAEGRHARRQGVPPRAGSPALERARRGVRAGSRPAPARRGPGAS